ncbi:MAG: hypothetical protein V2I48_03625 [Xanthomonadales bacterium]|jgi:hypothetical protein|nr:hypothetical protein [Xanthomonadales bacterium]
MLNTIQTKSVCRFAAFTLLALSTFWLSACATTPASESDIVIERAQARWDALTAGDLETAYTYYSPGYRSAHSLIDFGVSMRMRRVRWTEATYLDHSCEESRCLVRFDLGFKVANPVPGLSVYESTSKVEDTWIKTNGQWWYLPEK